MKSLISVIVPIYNVAPFLPKCLDSILSQSYSRLEIILIDDGSTDESSVICEEYARRDERISVLHKQNEGLIRARKDGFRMAHGDWIAFVDSDDWIDQRMFEELVMLGLENEADIVVSAVKLVVDDGVSYKGNAIKPGVYVNEELKGLKERLIGGEEYFSFPILPYLWNKLWRKDILQEALLIANDSIRVGEDVAIGFPAMLEASCIAVTQEAYYFYRQNVASMLRQNKDQDRELENTKRLCEYLQNRLAGKKHILHMRRGLSRLCINQLLTRSYGLVNQRLTAGDGCFPFLDVVDKPVIIYGAGAFGSAVYEYASERFGVKAWIDASATFLRKIGYPVVTLEDANIGDEDIVIVPIFVRKTALVVREALLKKGVNEDRILLFQLTEQQEDDLMRMMDDIRGMET